MPKPRVGKGSNLERRAERRAEQLADPVARASARERKAMKEGRWFDDAVRAAGEGLGKRLLENLAGEVNPMMEPAVVEVDIRDVEIERLRQELSVVRRAVQRVRVARVVTGRKFRVRRDPGRLSVFDGESGEEYRVLVDYGPRVDRCEVGQRLAFIAQVAGRDGGPSIVNGQVVLQRVVGTVERREEFFAPMVQPKAEAMLPVNAFARASLMIRGGQPVEIIINGRELQEAIRRISDKEFFRTARAEAGLAGEESAEGRAIDL